MPSTKRKACSPPRGGHDEKPWVRQRLAFEKCMSCFKLFEYEGEIEEDKRLPVAPCSGCGYQLCLKCLRKQQLQDASYRINQVLAENVRCPSPGCKGSFNATKPVVNELACLLMKQSEDQKREIDNMKKEVRSMKEHEKEMERTMKQIKQEPE